MLVLGGATSFIHAKNQSPVEMCALSVLSAAALLCQGLFDVGWRAGKRSPTSLFIVVEAETGERKSANDDEAYLHIREFDAEQDVLEKESLAAYEMDHALWKLKVKESRKLIAKLGARGQNTCEEEEILDDLISEEPQKQKFARMLVVDATQPALAHHLGNTYPYAGLNTDEGSSILKSGVLRDLGMHNTLWQAGNWSSNRIGRGRMDLRNCRFSSYWQIQPGIMDGYIDKGDNHYHATGYSSRAFHVCAKSTQGTRNKKFVEVREEDIGAYHARVKEFLNQYRGPAIPIPELLTLSPATSELLGWFDEVKEKELLEGGRFFHMRGAASKIVENAARLAAILHAMEKIDGPIPVHVMRNAIKLAAWLLNQYRLRFCPKSQLELDMISLEEFITDRIAPRFAKEKSVPGPYLCRFAPRQLRQVDRLWEALKGLESRDKVKVWGDKGRSWNVQLVDWFPQPLVATQLVNDPLQIRSSRWDKPSYPPDSPKPEVPNNGYELWPGVYLR